MLQEVIAAAEEKNEMEELKQLLPDIREKVEDAKESQRTASAASQAIQQTLVSTAWPGTMHTVLEGETILSYIDLQDSIKSIKSIWEVFI